METPRIIIEKDSLLVVDKPAGWIVNESSTSKNQPVLQEWLAKNFDFPVFEFPECRNGIVHRLDKETSGCLIVAKTKDAFENLQLQFGSRFVKKKYKALAHGFFSQTSGEINAAVGRLPWRRDRFGVLAGGRSAVTVYKVAGQYKKESEELSLVDLFPHTGRTHQIRIHLKYLGHPIVADTFYAGRKTAKKDRLWCPRLFLHAAEIEFSDPADNTLIKVESQLPADLQSVLDTLQSVS